MKIELVGEEAFDYDIYGTHQHAELVEERGKVVVCVNKYHVEDAKLDAGDFSYNKFARIDIPNT